MKRLSALLLSSVFLFNANAFADEPDTFIAHTKKHTTLTSTVPNNGDQNPYAVVVVPATVGRLSKGSVLVDNFNNEKNLQGTGSTIVQYDVAHNEVSLFTAIPKDLKGCPGGIGLTAAMAVLKNGWVIVGSTPSTDGKTSTLGKGCLIVLDAMGHIASTIANDNINGPWGNMAWVDNGKTATIFVSNAGFGVGSPDGEPPVVEKATVLRIDLAQEKDKLVVKKQTVVANGLGEQADKDVFLVGPTGLALAGDGTLYVSDATHNRVNAIPNALTRKDSAGTGTTVTQDEMLHRPLALAFAPNGHLLVTNGLNGQIVEIDVKAGKQLAAQWLNANKAQTPPGSGNLFGMALTPKGDGIYYVNDDVNTLALAH